MSRMSEIEWQPCLLTQRPAPELERRFEKETGRPGRLMRFFEGSAWVADVMVRVSVQITTVVRLDSSLVDQAGLVISQDNSCRFCFGVQRAFLRVLGMSETRITQLEQDLLIGDFSPRDRAALDFARRISRSKPLTGEDDLVPLRENGFSDDEIVELTGLIGLHLFLNRMSTFVALSPQQMEDMPDKWWVRFARPLLAVKFRNMRHRGKAVALLEIEKTGPLSDCVNALDGLLMARDLRLIIDRLWESSPILSELEQVLIPLARETVWYQPAQIQRCCAEVQSQMSAEQFLDFCGAAALLNALCRLGVIVDMRG